jgi:hypothetical protein
MQGFILLPLVFCCEFHFTIYNWPPRENTNYPADREGEKSIYTVHMSQLGWSCMQEGADCCSWTAAIHSLVWKSPWHCFMGTPHRESKLAGLAKPLSNMINMALLQKRLRADLLNNLEIPSTTLTEVTVSATHCLAPLEIVSFYEQKNLEPPGCRVGREVLRRIPILTALSGCWVLLSNFGIVEWETPPDLGGS